MKLTPTQNHAFNLAAQRKKQVVIYGGSIRSGKTYWLLLTFITLASKYANSRWLVVRQSLPTLKRTTLVTFQSIVNEGLNDWIKDFNRETYTVTFTNDSQIIFMAESYDTDKDLNRFRGLEINGGGIDEINECHEETFIKIIERSGSWTHAEGNPPICILGSCNPANNWVKEKIYDRWKEGKLPPKWAYVPAKITDNPHIPQDYIQSLKENMPLLAYQKFVEGDWEINMNENPFFWAYNRSKHDTTEPPQLQPNFEWVLSFDFNQDPTTLIVAARKQPFGAIHIIDHITANQYTEANASPLEATCRIFHRKYIQTGICLPSFIVVTGDAAGRAGSADRVAARDFYDTIKRELKLSNGQMKVPKANAPHTFSRELCNYALSKLNDGLLTFQPDTSKLCAEIQASYPDSDGTLNKAKKELGLHAVDAWRYMMHYLFKFDKYKNEVDVFNKYSLTLSNNKKQ